MTQIFNSTGQKILKKLAKDEKEVNCNNLLFKINDKSVVKNVDFLKEFGTLYDLLVYLVGNTKTVLSSAEDQINFFKAIYILKATISSTKNDITDRSEEQKNFLENKKVF